MALSKAVTLFPTPTARDWKGPTGPNFGHTSIANVVKLFPTPTVNGNYNRRGVSPTSGDGLATVVKQFPTPTAQDAKNATLPPSQIDRDSIPGHLLREGIEGLLNPDWVDVLMGFPQGWSLGLQSSISIKTIQQHWRDGTWEDGIPRVAVKIPFRAKRLRCLGNAIVPQCAAVIAAYVVAHYLRSLQ